MLRVPPLLHHFVPLVYILLALLGDTTRFLLLCLRPPAALVAENLFLRKQLALYQERQVKPRRATDATRLALVWLGRWFDWRQGFCPLNASHDTLACQFTNVPVGLSFHAHTCSV